MYTFSISKRFCFVEVIVITAHNSVEGAAHFYPLLLPPGNLEEEEAGAVGYPECHAALGMNDGKKYSSKYYKL